MYICTCTNCNKVFNDLNHGNESLVYPEIDTLPDLPIVEHYPEDYTGYGCDVCKTDGFLVDNYYNHSHLLIKPENIDTIHPS